MPDFRMLIIHALNIAILYIILRMLVYKPVKRFMDERSARIEGELARAQATQQEAQGITDQAQSILDGAREESRGIINQGAQKAKADADAIIQNAEGKALEILRQARLDAEAEKEAYKRELQTQVGELALEMAGQILAREIRVEDNTAIIERFFSQPGVMSSDKGSQL